MARACMASTPAHRVLEVRVHPDLPCSRIPSDDVLSKTDLAELVIETVADIADDPIAARARVGMLRDFGSGPRLWG